MRRKVWRYSANLNHLLIVLRNPSTFWWNVATVKQYMATTDDRMGDRNARFLWELWRKYRETDCHATNSRICLCRGIHNWRGIGKIDFPSVKWMLFKTTAESFSNYQKVWYWRIQRQIDNWRGRKREQEKSCCLISRFAVLLRPWPVSFWELLLKTF